SESQIRQLRQRAQHLHPRPNLSVPEIVSALCGIQTQEVEAGVLSICVRGTGLTAEDVHRAQAEARSIVRAWVMRGTLHLVTVEDLAWMLPLFGPGFVRGNRKRRLDLGLDEETGARGVRLLREVLGARGPLTKAEIVEALSAKGIPMEGQASIHLIGLAAALGWVCYGPPRGKKDTFVLLEDWVGHPLTPLENAVEHLAHRYLSAFAPATVEDFAAWAGLPLRECRAAWETLDVVEVQMGNKTLHLLKSQMDGLDALEDHPPVVRLLPRYDTYLLGYADRSLIIAPEHAHHIYPGGGMIHPAVLVDGEVGGKWKSVRKRGEIEVEMFGEVSKGVQDALSAFIVDKNNAVSGIQR
ncbi:MAG TPA: winged helix DNA-binding domain-containing protein, partial [Anaerolineales bacterium]|nr:winged helix DNA-binding domain-containing protein [Anaerolineales bacterium]